MMGYPSWLGLDAAETKEKSAPYRAAIKELWARLKRSQPEMQSAARPYVKPKWGEREYFLVQDCIFEAMDDGCARGSDSWALGVGDARRERAAAS